MVILHGLKLKSYAFEKYKTKNKKRNIYFCGRNEPSMKDKLNLTIEDGTFYTRDLVSEPGNILLSDEYAKRINSLKNMD